MPPDEGRILARVLLATWALATLTAAAPSHYLTHRLPRDRAGCYYLSEHYENGEHIDTKEPCLNCTCTHSMLMCYLRICPFVKPLGEDCVVDKQDGECCPRVWCPEGAYPMTTPPPTELAIEEEPGCYLGGVHYGEGVQLPADPLNPCEVCYCIRNSTACVLLECELHIPGCTPVYHEHTCCPTRYQCAPATTRPPFLEDDECEVDGVKYPDGAPVPQGDCQHCYCLHGEVACAVQECQPPGDGCVPAEPPRPGHCCPDRYDCPSTTTTAASTTTTAASTTTTAASTTTTAAPATIVSADPVVKQLLDRPTLVPGAVPGEGVCRLLNGTFVPHGAATPSEDPCRTHCQCLHSVVYCDSVECRTPPGLDVSRCSPVASSTDCCPDLSCPPDSFTGATAASSVTPDVPARPTPDEAKTTLTPAPPLGSTTEVIARDEATTKEPFESEILPITEIIYPGTNATIEPPITTRLTTPTIEDDIVTEGRTHLADITTTPQPEVTTGHPPLSEEDRSTELQPATEAEVHSDVTTVVSTTSPELTTVTTEGDYDILIIGKEHTKAPQPTAHDDQVTILGTTPETIHELAKTTETTEVEISHETTEMPSESTTFGDLYTTTEAVEVSHVSEMSTTSEGHPETTPSPPVEATVVEDSTPESSTSSSTTVPDYSTTHPTSMGAETVPSTTEEEQISVDDVSREVTQSTATDHSVQPEKTTTLSSHETTSPSAQTEITTPTVEFFVTTETEYLAKETMETLPSQDQWTMPEGMENITLPTFGGKPTVPTSLSTESITEVPVTILDVEATTELFKGCSVGNDYYRFGEPVPDANPCKYCYCLAERVLCAERVCKPPREDCLSIPIEQGQCCPSFYRCPVHTSTAITTEEPEAEVTKGLSDKETQPPVESTTERKEITLPASTTSHPEIQSTSSSSEIDVTDEVTTIKSEGTVQHDEAREPTHVDDVEPSTVSLKEETMVTESEMDETTSESIPTGYEEYTSITTTLSTPTPAAKESTTPSPEEQWTTSPPSTDAPKTTKEATEVTHTDSPLKEAKPVEEETTSDSINTSSESLVTTSASIDRASESVDIETTSQSVETTSESLETTSESVETTSEKIETMEASSEATSESIETTSEIVETTSEKIEKLGESTVTTGESSETTSEWVETTSESVKTTSEKTETMEESTEATSESIETTSESIETTSESVETTSEKIEKLGESTVTTSESLETTSESLETTSESEETTSEKIETLGESAITTSESAETTSEAIETMSESTGTTSESIERTSEAVETTSETRETISESTVTPKESIETTSKHIETMAESTETTVGGVETTSEGRETTSEIQETTSKKIETMGESTETTSESSKTTSEDIEFSSESTKPVDEETTSEHAESVESTTETEEHIDLAVTVLPQSTLIPKDLLVTQEVQITTQKPEISTEASDISTTVKESVLSDDPEKSMATTESTTESKEIFSSTEEHKIIEEEETSRPESTTSDDVLHPTSTTSSGVEEKQQTSTEQSSVESTTGSEETSSESSSEEYDSKETTVVQAEVTTHVTTGQAEVTTHVTTGQAEVTTHVTTVQEEKVDASTEIPEETTTEEVESLSTVLSRTTAGDEASTTSVPETTTIHQAIASSTQLVDLITELKVSPNTTTVLLEGPHNLTTAGWETSTTTTTLSEEDLEKLTTLMSTKTTSSPTPVPTRPTSPPSFLDEGVCYFEGRVYQSAEQIPRDNACEFCFCFRGDIICLQQSCPPPISHCRETPISGFCCPRYECPVQNMTDSTLLPTSTTTTMSPTPPRAFRLLAASTTGCEVKGRHYAVGEVVRPSSGPCLQCRCEEAGLMQCDPQDCKPQAPLVLRMHRPL